jgi:hypothetical protein
VYLPPYWVHFGFENGIREPLTSPIVVEYCGRQYRQYRSVGWQYSLIWSRKWVRGALGIF